MGILSEPVVFTESLPSATELVNALCQHTGEAVSFDEETEILSCIATGDATGFWALIYKPNHSWTLRNLNLNGGYLWDATLAVLQLLGGKRDDSRFTQAPSLPAWAYTPWELAKYEYKKKNVQWITHEEALTRQSN